MFLFKVVYLYTRNLSHGMASEETGAGWIYTTGEEAGCPANMEEIWLVAYKYEFSRDIDRKEYRFEER